MEVHFDTLSRLPNMPTQTAARRSGVEASITNVGFTGAALILPLIENAVPAVSAEIEGSVLYSTAQPSKGAPRRKKSPLNGGVPVAYPSMP